MQTLIAFVVSWVVVVLGQEAVWLGWSLAGDGTTAPFGVELVGGLVAVVWFWRRWNIQDREER